MAIADIHNGYSLKNTAFDVLAAMPTGHETCETARDIAARLGDMTPAQVAGVLGHLGRLGLVERDAQDSTWARYDSDAPGLDVYKVATLARAEVARPSCAQAQALDSFGPQGITPRPGVGHDAARAESVHAGASLEQWAREAARQNLHFRAADLFRRAVKFYAGHGRRARLEQAAQAQEALGREQEAAQVEITAQARLDAIQSRALVDAQATKAGAALEAAEIAPGHLNGHRVLMAWPRPSHRCAFVLVDRGDSCAQRYVLASWWRDLGRAWQWGHYFDGLADVAAYLEAEARRAA